jgi:hypothetical protein
MWGFGLAFLGLVLGAIAMMYDWKPVIVLGACGLMWGHYWDAANPMTLCSMVAPPRFKATATGVGYAWIKVASFFGAFAFPVLSVRLGAAGATFLVAVASLVGFVTAALLLPEIYGYVETEEVAAHAPAGE